MGEASALGVFSHDGMVSRMLRPYERSHAKEFPAKRSCFEHRRLLRCALMTTKSSKVCKVEGSSFTYEHEEHDNLPEWREDFDPDYYNLEETNQQLEDWDQLI